MELDTEENDAANEDSEILLCLPQGKWGGGRLKVTGVRWAESARRKKSHSEVTFADKKAIKTIQQELEDDDYAVTKQGGVVLRMDNRDNARIVEMCYRTHTTLVNPIIDWTDVEVWEFIREYNVPYCSLYDDGFKRLGCIGCPMGSKEQREREFERWPKYKALYLKAFEKMIENRRGAAEAPNSRRMVQGVDYGKQTAEDVMQGYLTENFKDNIGGVLHEHSRMLGMVDGQNLHQRPTAAPEVDSTLMQGQELTTRILQK